MTRYEEGRAAPDRPPDRSTPSGTDFDEFFAEHNTGLFGALWLVPRDRHEAEELTQDAFVKVWERWDQVRELDDPVGYLYRTGMNLFRNRRRGSLWPSAGPSTSRRRRATRSGPSTIATRSSGPWDG